MSDDFELPSHQRDALDALPREAVPPADVEERTVRALRARGLLRTTTSHTVRWAAAAAAAVLLFVAGFAAGRRTAGPKRDEAAPVRAAVQPDSATRVVAWF